MKKTVLKLSPAPIKKNETLELLQEIQNRAYSNMGTLYNIDEIVAHFNTALMVRSFYNYREAGRKSELKAA